MPSLVLRHELRGKRDGVFFRAGTTEVSIFVDEGKDALQMLQTSRQCPKCLGGKLYGYDDRDIYYCPQCGKDTTALEMRKHDMR